jgi:ribosomal-protein-alanine N-acetyltransferase
MSGAAGVVCVRAMVEGDLDQVMQIAAGLATAPQWVREAYLGALISDGTARHVALVAELEGFVAGYVVAGAVEAQAELESIAVAEWAQKRGVGKALLGALIGRLKEGGVADLTLEVRESNQAARRFYEIAGFLEIGRRRGYYREPDEDALVLRLAFDSQFGSGSGSD